jgi:hypothetical protein
MNQSDTVKISSELMYRYYKHDGSAIGSPVSRKALSHFDAFEKIKALPFGESDEASFFLATCYLNVLRFSLVQGAENVVTRDIVLSNAYHNGKAKMIPFSKYGLMYRVFRMLVVLDRIVGNRIFKRAIHLGVRKSA